MVWKILLILFSVNVLLFSQDFNSEELTKKYKIKSVTIYQELDDTFLHKILSLFTNKRTLRKSYLSYYPDGHEKDYIEFNFSGKISLKYYCKYDSKENKETIYFFNERLNKYHPGIAYQFNKKGDIEREIGYDMNGCINSTTENKYIGEKLLETTTTGKFESQYVRTKFSYYENGELAEEVQYTTKGTISNKAYYTYFPKYNVKKVVSFSSGKEIVTHIFKLNKSGQLIERIEFNPPYKKPKLTEYYSYIYNKDGTITKCIQKNESGKIIKTFDYVYHYYN